MLCTLQMAFLQPYRSLELLIELKWVLLLWLRSPFVVLNVLSHDEEVIRATGIISRTVPSFHSKVSNPQVCWDAGMQR